jgi:5-(carboxyamino)imidazole ribonucleotide mutase
MGKAMRANEGPIVGIIVGSRSDLALAEECEKTLLELGISSEIVVASAHRSPKYLEETLERLAESVKVFIGIAGMAAHLPGFIAGRTVRPVIGVPTDASLLGIDALLSIVQMPAGVPVASVGVNGARNAGLLAAEILALTKLGEKLKLEEKLIQLRQNAERQARKSAKTKG